QGSQWRLSPYETAYFFASRVLGLSPDRNMAAPEPLGDGLYTIVVRTRTSCSSQPQLRCPPEDVRLVLRQLDNSPKGIWSVVSAQTAGFPDLPAVGAELVAGEPAEISTQVPADQNVYVAFVGLDECAGWEYDVIRSASDVSLRTPTPPEAASDGCPVALIAMHNDPGIQQLTGLGRRLLDYGNRIALYEVLAVPIRLLPSAASGSVPEVATVTCEGASITVDTSVVAAQSDGIHIDVTTIGDTPVSFHVAEDAGADSAVSSQGRGTNESSAEVILQSAPGRYVLSCTAPQEGGVGIASLEVVDPNGSFVPAEPECSGGEAWGMSPAYAPGALGDRGDPVEIARMRLTGLQEGDVVERAGYAQGDGTAIVRIVRDGAVVAKVELFDDGQGGWLLSSMDGCGDAQFGWSSEGSEPTGPSGELCEPPSADLLIVVDEGEFESDVGCVSAPAGESLTITLDNRDSSGHNIWIYPLALDEPVFRGPPCFGPDHITYSVRPLEAGRYRLVDNMNPGGAEMTLVVN
ncbi:MAG TPA: cupredoxin domain-containing protein, partial [Actinomycetota bacterium]|nr:cupredoxin domain-containing protein [Actinomycetota bacterium]